MPIRSSTTPLLEATHGKVAAAAPFTHALLWLRMVDEYARSGSSPSERFLTAKARYMALARTLAR